MSKSDMGHPMDMCQSLTKGLCQAIELNKHENAVNTEGSGNAVPPNLVEIPLSSFGLLEDGNNIQVINQAKRMPKADGMKQVVYTDNHVDLTKESAFNTSESYNDDQIQLKGFKRHELEDNVEDEAKKVEPIENTNDQDDKWLESLRQKKYDLDKKIPLDSDILYFLQLPELASIEIKILKNLIERREENRNWALNKEICLKQDSLRHLKRKRTTIEQSNIRQMRRKIDVKETKEARESNIEISLENSVHESPKQREDLITAFGIGTPSPLVKMGKIKEEEMRRIKMWKHENFKRNST